MFYLIFFYLLTPKNYSNYKVARKTKGMIIVTVVPAHPVVIHL